MHPYIGITDFTDVSQVEEMSRVFEAHRSTESTRKLHVGVMMSYKTLHDIPSRWEHVFPRKERIAHIFSSPDEYNCLHYADYDNYPDLAESLLGAILYGGSNLHALQLDMVWPDPMEIARAIRASGRHVEVILQIGKNAMEAVDNDPGQVVARLRGYRGVVQRVLLDKSMGQGLGMDAQALLPYARAIRDAMPDIGIGAAGGLGPTSVHLVEPLLAEFPDLSIDAQGRLRASGNAQDPIDWNMAGTYLAEALKLLK